MKKFDIKKIKRGDLNLTKQQWDEMLDTKTSIQKTAQQVRESKISPWVQSLLYKTSNKEKILDLGSGSGQISAVLAMAGRETTLLDWSPENIDFSKKLFTELNIKANFFQSDMTKGLPFEDESFETVFSYGVFEYFNDREILLILSEVFRVAKKQVIIMVPNAASISYRIGVFYKKLINNMELETERSFYSFKQYFKQLGKFSTTEYSVGAKQSLKFLTMPFGNFIAKFLISRFHLVDHANPSFLNQGQVLMSFARKDLLCL